MTGAPLHDVITLWAVVNEDHMIYREIPVRIIVNLGEAFGQSVGDFRNMIDKAEYPLHKVAMNFNYTEFISDFYKTMKNSHSSPESEQ